MTQKLAKSNYRDTRFLSNATANEKNKKIILSMYQQTGRFDPSNKFIVNYRNKDIINIVKQYMLEKLHKMEIDKINEENIENKNKQKIRKIPVNHNDSDDKDPHTQSDILSTNHLGLKCA